MLKRSLKCLLLFLIAMLCNSCGKWYYCTVSGFGTTPNEKTYYIVPIDSNLIGDLEFNEYAGILRNRLNESGYRESNSETAALCVKFGYIVGERQFEGTVTSSGGFTTTNGKITSNTSANANGTATTNIFGNSVNTTANAKGTSSTNIKTNQQINTYNYSSTSAVYVSDIGCYIEAFDINMKKPVWSVEVKDHLRDGQSFRKIMPWMIASAQTYFGKNGEGQVKITEKEGRERMGLVWPY